MKRIAYFQLFIVIACLFCACNNNEILQPKEQHIPNAPDYADSKMWVMCTNDTDGQGADVFYIPSTWEYDWFTNDSIVCHYADVHNKKHRDNMAIEINKVAKYMAEGNNFYSPYYRHITLNTWATLNEDTIKRRYHAISFVDIQNAFNHYLTHYNQGRPFILAGFSQGGKSVVELMKTLPANLRDKLIASYVLGYKVTPDDVTQAPWIVAAQDSTDTGVTICYNSVSDVQYVKPIISGQNVMCINPVNWRTDATPAILQDTITVTLNTEHKVLVLDGFDGSYLKNILNIINVGDYHSIEPWVYSECLRKNFKQRINAYKKK